MHPFAGHFHFIFFPIYQPFEAVVLVLILSGVSRVHMYSTHLYSILYTKFLVCFRDDGKRIVMKDNNGHFGDTFAETPGQSC